MKSKLISLISLITLILGISPLAALAAGTDVTFGSGVSVGITVGGGQENFTLEGALETVTVNASNVSIGVNSGSGASLTSSAKRNFSYGGSIGGQATCGASSSVLSMSGTAQNAETVTPLESTCSTASGSGGGGGGSTTTTEPTTTTEVTTSAAAAVTTTTTPAPIAQAPTTPAPSVAQPSPVAQLVSPVFNADLQIGSKGDDVKRLQELLAQDKEIYPEGLTTGTYGQLTSAAVKKFQAKYGLPQVGRVGPATRAKIAEVYQAAAPVAQPSPSAAEEAQRAALQKQLDDLQKQLDAMLKQL